MAQIIIVEGKSDTRRLMEVYQGEVITFETSGLGINEEMISDLKRLQKANELIVFTDPDNPGEIIRNRLNKNLTDLVHAYLPNEKAISSKKRKVGIEYASDEDIKNALKNLHHINKIKKYTLTDLIDWELYNNQERRKLFCNELNISYGNNKKVLKELNMFGIEETKIEKALENINE